MKLLGPFSKLLDGVVSDTFVRNWLNLLCFLLSGASRSLLSCPVYDGSAHQHISLNFLFLSQLDI